VPSGGARRGRRDNGLVAAEYAAVGDVDPRVGEHLLDVLAIDGIAAYLQPAADLHPITRTSTVPARPTDRLFADREHLSTARGYLRQLRADEERSLPRRRPEPNEQEPTGDPELADAFAEIVAGYDLDADPAAAPWPAAEDVSDDEAADRTAPNAGRLRFAPEAVQPSLLDGLDTFGADLADDDEGYTPPPPPPLPRLSRAAVVAMISIAGGLVLFFSPGLLPIGADMSLLLGFGAVLTGFVMLIWRLRPGDDEDSDPDDGAVV
jgi:hypothetical protein